MKWLPLTVLFLSHSLFALEGTPATTDKSLTVSETPASSVKPATPVKLDSTLGQRFIRDTISIPLRNGASSGYKIIHNGLKSGTAVTLLQVNAESQYSYVRTSEGIEGWLPSQYLIEEIPNSVKLAKSEELIKKLSLQAGPNGEQLVDVNKKNQELLQTIDQLTEELEHIKSIAANEIRLSDENKKLLAEYEEAKNKRDTLMSENQRLQSQVTQDSFINGAIAVILGIIATLIIQHITKANKRHSDWA